MQILYPSYHCWTKPISENHLLLFGESARRKLRNTIGAVEAAAVTTTIEKLDEATLEWFIPMYEGRMKEKQSPRIYNVRGTTLANPDKTKVFYTLTLFEAGIPLGATIFSLTNRRLSIAYRTYATEWHKAKLTASPSLYAEWVIAEYALKQQMQRFVHGRNQNPYGIFSNIGLAIFKLSVGCIPKKSKHSELLSADTNSFKEDVLVLAEPEKKKRINMGYLIVAEQNYSRYEQVTKYPEQLQVEVIFRK